jgi:HAD superfamily hydrolase (TIGR01549 family)
MAALPPRAILFDIGSTLWSSPAEVEAGLRACYEEGRERLVAALSDVPHRDVLIEAVEGYFAEWEDRWKADSTIVEQAPTTAFVAEALVRVGLTAPEEALQKFTDALLETSVHTARAEAEEPEMRAALIELQGLGMRLGCVSNAFMGAATLQRIMVEKGLGEHLELIISSCELGYRKPHPAIYQAALDAMGVRPGEVIFVGDRLDADVAGPAALGMRTVLTLQYRQEDHTNAAVRPDAVIYHLSELVPYVQGLLKQAK